MHNNDPFLGARVAAMDMLFIRSFEKFKYLPFMFVQSLLDKESVGHLYLFSS